MPHAGRLSRLLEPQTNRTTGPPSVTDYAPRFPGKKTHCRHLVFLSRSLSGAKSMSKVAKGREKTRDKNGKTAKCAEEQDEESTYSFQNCDSRQVFCIQMFLHQEWYLHKERETSFLTLCMVNFGLTTTSLFKIWTSAWSSASTSRFHKGSFFLFLTDWYSSFLV